MYYHGLDPSNPFKCKVCGQLFVVPSLAKDCAVSHDGDDDD